MVDDNSQNRKSDYETIETIQKIVKDQFSQDFVSKKIVAVFDAEIQKDLFRNKCKEICRATYDNIKKEQKKDLYKHPMIGYIISFVTLLLSIVSLTVSICALKR